ncbi:hypothetical protein AXG93_1927s1050 [Marchantia polymorpha subsp. ruderalis]|uniref:Uncharacterized protein n=1 Tax=Marchantia polymorpha subsp. ruderalis TaxID=1480154 RepID=A0A176W4L0_MARPO|nr:hypothetical protein AXG93_1927s1050 [Marchantia polymorpha subsp. ruderalis]
MAWAWPRLASDPVEGWAGSRTGRREQASVTTRAWRGGSRSRVDITESAGEFVVERSVVEGRAAVGWVSGRLEKDYEAARPSLRRRAPTHSLQIKRTLMAGPRRSNIRIKARIWWGPLALVSFGYG